MPTSARFSALVLTLALSLSACGDDEDPMEPPPPEFPAGPFDFAGPVFDIDAGADGSAILVAETVFPGAPGPTTVSRIAAGGVEEVITIDEMDEGVPLNGLARTGDGEFLFASGALDLAVGAGAWRAADGQVSLVGDIEAFEIANDPDATVAPMWKTPACEENPDQGFSAGPQSNPYHLVDMADGSALVADAAGNTLHSVPAGGGVELVAVFTPPEGEDGEFMVLFPLDEDTDCFVQPVPTSVAVGPDGDYYVGELTGATPANLGGEPSTGLSRVWRVDAGSRSVVCPSASCEEVVSGLTSVIDVAFGPDGDLFVVEYDANGWFAATALDMAAGGAVKRCDTGSGQCTTVEDGLTLPGAVTFDGNGDLWLLEDNIGSPTVRRLALP